MLPVILTTFGIIFFAELPDKTALASLVLATRYPARQVIIGAWLAFLVQTVVAVAAGSFLHLFPAQPIRVLAGLGFLAFAVLALHRKEEEDLALEAREVGRTARRSMAPWMASFLVVFAAEWGDLTQMATAALVAQAADPLPVALGAIGALWCVTVLAVVAGAQLGRLVTQRLLKRLSAGLFAVAGLLVIGSAFVGP